MSRLLVVEDEPRIASFVARALRAEGMIVDVAAEGHGALRMATDHQYDLIVLDLLLPGLDGMAVLRDVLAERPEQRVLVLSALSDIRSRVAALELGAVDFLPKPFALAELLARVRARLRQPAAAPSAPAQHVMRVGRVTLDVLARTADAGRGAVPLSEREFQLLQHLMRKADVASREELLANVWGYSFDPASNVVDVCVGRLRSKLGADVIETVRNVGYRIEAA